MIIFPPKLEIFQAPGLSNLSRTHTHIQKRSNSLYNHTFPHNLQISFRRRALFVILRLGLNSRLNYRIN